MWFPRCCLPVASKIFSACCLAVFHLTAKCGLPVVRCGFPDVFSQLPPKFLRLLAGLPLVSQVWSPSCLLNVSQMRLPRWCCPSCLQGFSIRCLVMFHLSPGCGLPVVSQMWFPRCCLPVVSKMLSRSPLVVYVSSTSLPDVVSQLPRR